DATGRMRRDDVPRPADHRTGQADRRGRLRRRDLGLDPARRRGSGRDRGDVLVHDRVHQGQLRRRRRRADPARAGARLRGGAADELIRAAQESIAAAETLGCPRLNLHGTGLDGKGLPVVPGEDMPGPLWISAARTLTRLGELAERAGVTFCLENLNIAVDHPGVPFPRPADTIALVEAVGHPRVRLMLDLYHAQIGEGNLIELVRRAGPLIGEIQVADVPGRREPGTGEINYPAVAAALADMGYEGTVGLEAWAADGDSDRALARFRDAFTV